ncbi:hypothetical protein KY319_04830 [Candidatus Woesearchaeota archaeon]|nr:hypothetical protein [Candidatus Woesearchaeota archaeon]
MNDWRAYVMVGVLGVFGFFYSCNQRVSVQAPKSGRQAVVFTDEARDVLQDRLVRSDLSKRQIAALLNRVDLDDDCVIDEFEAEELASLLGGGYYKESSEPEFYKQDYTWGDFGNKVRRSFQPCPVLPDPGKPMSLSDYYRSQQRVYSYYK